MSGGKRAPSSSVNHPTASGRVERASRCEDRFDHFEPGEDAEVAVVATAGADGVDVRPGHHRRDRRIEAGHRRDDVADAVGDDVEPELVHPAAHEVAAGSVLVGERQPGTAGRALDRADFAELHQPAQQPVDVDAQGVCGHRRDSTSGALQSVKHPFRPCEHQQHDVDPG